MKTHTLALCGVLAEDFTLDHVCMDECFYRSRLKIHRKSGKPDYIPLLVPACLDPLSFSSGEKVEILGQFRSYNEKVSDCCSHLVLYALTDSLRRVSGAFYEPCNKLCLSGFVCKNTHFRRTPLGRNICDVLLAVDRECGKSDYIPLVFWGPLAKQAATFCVGLPLHITGRIQSRYYCKNGEMKEAYEVSVGSFE